MVCPCTSFLFLLYLSLFFDMLVLKADEAARESRQSKQDHYAEMRRRKDEEREAQERALVGWSLFFLVVLLYVCLLCSCSWFTFWLNTWPWLIGRRSQGSESKRGGSCCIGVWEVERGIFNWCWRYYRKWSARWRSGLACWLRGIHKGISQFSTYDQGDLPLKNSVWVHMLHYKKTYL